MSPSERDRRQPGAGCALVRLVAALAALAAPFLAAAAPLTSVATDPSPEVQFDVFMGFDDQAREGHWFPVVFDVRNDGPPVQGTVVLHPEGSPDSQRYAFDLDLPTGTRKRRLLPVFAASGRHLRWEATLLDLSGTLMADRAELQPKIVAASMPLIGALPRSLGGLPTLPLPPQRAPELLPTVVRLQPDLLPDHPIVLEALAACYLHSERASELLPHHVEALLAWLLGGGHLIVAIEQPSDVTSIPWLRNLLPFAPATVAQVPAGEALHRWLQQGASPVLTVPVPVHPTDPGTGGRSARLRPSPTPQTADPYLALEPHPAFLNSDITVVTGVSSPAQVLVAQGNTPLLLASRHGRGWITVLTFSPEREPFRSWDHRDWFWARLLAVPPELLDPGLAPRRSGVGVDGVFGAMLDSRQIRKLPVGTLLLLLVLYLAVIGPLDRWILRRLNRQMWTWITFPVYVALFAALIYLLGYRLRSGDLEWNEVQVVDQIAGPTGSHLRGRTWISLYSPVNARYRLSSEVPFSTLRPEFHPSGSSSRSEAGRLQLWHPAVGFQGETFMPLWVSQLYVNDWFQPASPLVQGSVEPAPEGLRALVVNRSALSLNPVRLAYRGQLHELGPLPPGQRLDRILPHRPDTPLSEALDRLPQILATAQQRRSAFGREDSGRIDLTLDAVILASLGQNTLSSRTPSGEVLVSPAGFSLSTLALSDQPVLFAWSSNQSLALPIHQFTPRRSRKDVVVRAVLSAPESSSSLHNP
ncbi:MAG: hypothetical protein KF833_09115 [Verrucomicrobiae bacterium]|nr:hypothetical protein [Verrucomicrobiae bacterium]